MPNAKPAAFTAIEVLRGIAALSVFLSHSDASDLATTAWLTANRFVLGKFGVFLFFGISGLLIWQSARRYLSDHQGLKIYAIHRLTRILPLYLLNIAFVVLLLQAIGSSFTPVIDWHTIWRHLTFTQSLLPIVHRALNPVLWTLTHEMLFYVLVPGLFYLQRIVPIGWPLAALGAYSAYTIGVLPAGAETSGGSGMFISPFIEVLWAFMAGIALAVMPKRFVVWFALLLAALALASDQAQLSLRLIGGLWGLSLLALVLSPLSLRLFATRFVTVLLAPLAWLGAISYSLYIWHYLIISIFEAHSDMIGAIVPWWSYALPRAIVFIGTVLAISWLSYRLIERPAMGPLRRWLQSGLETGIGHQPVRPSPSG